VTGSALLFNHDVMHKGEVVSKGTKYILRTDIMFKREAGSTLGVPQSLLMNPDFLRMDALYKKSIELQKAGDPKGSTEAYLAAQQIQTRFPSVTGDTVQEQRAALASSDWPLGFDVTIAIFLYLPMKDIASCSQVCKLWHSISSDPSLWRMLFFRKWPFIAKVERLMGLNPAILDYAKPWKLAYRQRLEAEKNFNVIFFDIGSQTTRFGMSGASDEGPPGSASYDPPAQEVPAQEVPDIPSIVALVKGHYWSANEGMEQYLVGPDVKGSYFSTYRPIGPFQVLSPSLRKDHPSALAVGDEYDGDLYHYSYNIDHAPSLSSDGSTLIHWNAIRNLCTWAICEGFRPLQSGLPHPLLIAVPSFFKEKEMALLHYMVRNLLSSRAVSFVSSSVLALLAVNKKTGLVILSGHNFTSITPVWEGGPIFEHEVFLPYAGSEVEAEWKSGDAEKLASKVDSVFFPADPLKNLAHLAFSAVMACDEAKRTELFACVLLAGGNMFSLETRFRRELAEVAKDSPHHPEIVIPEDRMTAVVFGARQFCSYSGVRDLFSAEYTPQKRRWGNVYPCY